MLIENGPRAGDIYEYVGNSSKIYDYLSSNGSRTVRKGDLVLLEDNYNSSNGLGGHIYRYIDDQSQSINMGSENYKSNRWEQVGSGYFNGQDFANRDQWEQDNLVDAPTEVLAYSENSAINATGSLTLSAEATGEILATVLTGSAAIAAAGPAAVGLSGARALPQKTSCRPTSWPTSTATAAAMTRE